jgi:uncharacterized membrane protein
MTKKRIESIDALRGIVMLLMIIDHTREFFYMHAQVSDPVDLSVTGPELFFTRLAAHFCAPVFVFLTGLSAWLYKNAKGSTQEASIFLLKRGAFLIFLELTLVGFAWSFTLFPQKIFLQVIWAIGISMIALAGIMHAPRWLMAFISFGIVFGHNLLDPITFLPHENGFVIWSILHDRNALALPWGTLVRTSYPVLPWIGVIGLGFLAGPWFSQTVDSQTRGKRLLMVSAASLTLFILLRGTNVYGEAQPWVGGSFIQTIMSFLNLTKYPPSADFLLLTLGVGILILWIVEKVQSKVTRTLAVYGSAPMFYYIIHLYLIHGLYHLALRIYGPTNGILFSVPSVGWLWIMSVALAIPLWYLCRWFSGVKQRSRSSLLKYF